MKLIPAKNFVLLKPLTEQKNESGIIIPEEKGKEKPQIGIVYSVGEGKQPFPVPMKKGDKCLYQKYMDNTLVIPGLGEIVNPVKFDDLTVLIKTGGKK